MSPIRNSLHRPPCFQPKASSLDLGMSSRTTGPALKELSIRWGRHSPSPEGAPSLLGEQHALKHTGPASRGTPDPQVTLAPDIVHLPQACVLCRKGPLPSPCILTSLQRGLRTCPEHQGRLQGLGRKREVLRFGGGTFSEYIHPQLRAFRNVPTQMTESPGIAL